MMKKLIVGLLMLPSVAMAQQPAPPTQADYFKQTISACIAESASLYEQANKFAAEAQRLKGELEALKKQVEEKK
jgi:hypothetical protein